jgi:coenzyme F420-reducing hydrogenase beta subunit/polysaccharide pyruvyl transferase WcaK-like protein
MHFVRGQFNPVIDETLCTNCGLCLSFCPGFDIDPYNIKKTSALEKIFSNSYLESYTAFCKDSKIRIGSTSGGLVTTIIVELIKKNEFDSAFVLDFASITNQPLRLSSTSNVKSIIAAAKSKYLPSSVFNIVKALKNDNCTSYIITALPCQVLGIKKLMRHFKIAENRLMTLGLFCDLNLNLNFIKYLEYWYAKKNEQLNLIEYRTKEKTGWPGDMKLIFKSGRTLHVDRTKRIEVKKYFQLKRCLCCVDKLNNLSDIAFGDCYIPGEEDHKGKSSVIVRTSKGKEAFDKCSHLIEKSPVSIDVIKTSQNIHYKNHNARFLKACSKIEGLDKNVEFSDETLDQFNKRCKYITMGRDGNYRKIRYSLKWNVVAPKIKSILAKLIAITAIFNAILNDVIIFLLKSLRKSKFAGDNIIIVGAESLNKGAEAMLFTVVDEINEKFPSKNIYHFSTHDFYYNQRIKNNKTFEILPWEIATKIKVLNFWGHLLIKNNRKGETEKKIINVIKNAFCILDINGYHLHSLWGGVSAFEYLLNIIVAKRYLIPYIILPQSIGPFNFNVGYKILLFPLIWLYLRYPLKIFVREKSGIESLKKFKLKNVKKGRDIVLEKKGYNLYKIYKKLPGKKVADIKKNSVGVIFNIQVFKNVDNSKLYSLYLKAVNYLIAQNKHIYMLLHSKEDAVFFEHFYGIYKDSNQIHFLKSNYSAVEIENIISQFDFIISSRYHSIIHAFKNEVPAIVLGWADKYIELMKDFEQIEYFLDVRNKLSKQYFIRIVKKMSKSYKIEKEKIKIKYISIENLDIFRKVEKMLKSK